MQMKCDNCAMKSDLHYKINVHFIRVQQQCTTVCPGTCILVDDGISAKSPSFLASPGLCMGLDYMKALTHYKYNFTRGVAQLMVTYLSIDDPTVEELS